MTRTANAERQAKWRAENRAASRARCRDYHAANVSDIRERKRQYYQDVRKARNHTEEGKHKERDKNARRRSESNIGSVSFSEWNAIVAKHEGRCAYCKRDDRPLTWDHVQPLSKGGKHSVNNVVPACRQCNSAKGNR